MASPRLRALILGAVRGIVKPGYKYGITSQVREELLLGVLEREISGETFQLSGLVTSQLLNTASPDHKGTVLNRALGFINQGAAIKQLMPFDAVRQVLDPTEKKEIQKQSMLLKLLKKTDFFDRMQAILND